MVLGHKSLSLLVQRYNSRGSVEICMYKSGNMGKQVEVRRRPQPLFKKKKKIVLTFSVYRPFGLLMALCLYFIVTLIHMSLHCECVRFFLDFAATKFGLMFSPSPVRRDLFRSSETVTLRG